MAAVKVTFTLDTATVSRLSQIARQLGKSTNEIVRDAIANYQGRSGRLSQWERRRRLAAFDELVPQIPSRSLKSPEAEIRAIRRARRGGGRAGIAR